MAKCRSSDLKKKLKKIKAEFRVSFEKDLCVWLLPSVMLLMCSCHVFFVGFLLLFFVFVF